MCHFCFVNQSVVHNCTKAVFNISINISPFEVKFLQKFCSQTGRNRSRRKEIKFFVEKFRIPSQESYFSRLKIISHRWHNKLFLNCLKFQKMSKLIYFFPKALKCPGFYLIVKKYDSKQDRNCYWTLFTCVH
jgi:hypothetical protein